MEKLHFKTSITAPREKVWEILWGDLTYPMWTSVFAEGSSAETNWEEGEKVIFSDGKGQGMVSIIEKKTPHEFMSFKHLGIVSNGVEDTASDQINEWKGSLENYTLKNIDGKTELSIDMDIADQYKDYFLKTWPAALQKVKELAEKNS